MSTMNLETAPQTIEGMLKLARPEKYRLALFLDMFAGDDKAEQAFHLLSPDGQAQALFESMTIRLGGGVGPGSNGSAQPPIMHMQPAPQVILPNMPPVPGLMPPVPMPQQAQAPAQPVSRTPVTASDPRNAGSRSLGVTTSVQLAPAQPAPGIPPQPGAAPIAALQAIQGQLKAIMEKVGGLTGVLGDVVAVVEDIQETVAGHAKLLQICTMLGVVLTENAMPKMSRREILKMTQLYLNEGELRACVKQMDDEDDEGKE